MPPWHIERNVGIQKFKDDRREATPNRDDRVVGRRGAPKGSVSDMPAAPTFPDDEAWHIGTPDLIVEIPKPHVVPAAGGDLWIDYISDSGLTEDRYLQAVEAKPGPGARAVVHHLLTYLIQDIDQDEVLAGRLDDPDQHERFLNEFAVGKRRILPKDRKLGRRDRDPIQPALHKSGKRPRIAPASVESIRRDTSEYPRFMQTRTRTRARPPRTRSSATTAITASRSPRASPRSGTHAQRGSGVLRSDPALGPPRR